MQRLQARARAGAGGGARRSACPARCTARCCSMRGDGVLRPAILWNDGRSARAMRGARRRPCPTLHAVTGNLAMPGFTAPKLLWVRQHEPALFARIGARAAAQGLAAAAADRRGGQRPVGRLGHAVAGRRPAPTGGTSGLAACGLARAQMPRLVEGSEVGGHLRAGAGAALGPARGDHRGRRRRRQRRQRGRHRRGAARTGLRVARHLGRASSSATTASSPNPARPCTPSAMRCRGAGTACR